MKYRGLIISGIVLLLLGGFFVLLQIMFQPSHDRSWELGHEALPGITIDNTDVVTITNFRNFRWITETEAVSTYETKTFTKSDIESVDVIISHFADFEGLAHIFLSFGLRSGEYVTVSLETRREADETFSPLLGILRQYEIIYVVGSEQDLIGSRTGPRDERVYLYRTKASAEQARQLFSLLAEDINAIALKPRMYNTITRNCTNEITRRVEEMVAVEFPLSWRTLMPGYFHSVLYDLKLIDTNGTLNEVKERNLINNQVLDASSPTFSTDLRSQEPT